MPEQDELFQSAMAALGPALGRIAATYERDSAQRADLVQDIQIALWRSLARFDGRCTLKTWGWRVAHNVAVSHVGKAVRTKGNGWVGLDEIDDLPDDNGSEAGLGEQILLERIRAMVRRLKPPDGQIMLLYLEGEDAREIADVTGLSPAAVATRIHRTKSLLARHFGQGEPARV